MSGYITPSKTDSHTTPKKLYEELDKEFQFDAFYPCPINDSYLVNGLKIPWANSTFVNPPYSDLKTTKKNGLGWVEKAHIEAMSGKTIVLLIPSRTDTQWFHEIILKNNYEIRFLKGRLKFIDIYLIRESKKILHGIEKSIAKKGLEVETAKKDFFEAVETFRKEFPIADQDIDEPSEYELMVNKNTQSKRVKYKELKRMLTAKGKEHQILKDKVG